MLKKLCLAASLLLPATAHAQFSQPVRDVENPAQNAHMITGSFSLSAGSIPSVIHALPSPPTGKRLTVESLSLNCTVPSETNDLSATLVVRFRSGPSSPTQSGTFIIPMAKLGRRSATEIMWGGTLNGRVFMDNISLAPTFFNVYRYPTNTEMNCTYAVTGGLTNSPLQ